MTALYKITTPDSHRQLNAELDDRQRALLDGALNYHSLVNPGSTLTYHVFLSANEEYPRLTDTSTLTGPWAEDATELGTFTATSTVRGKTRPDDAYDHRAKEFVSATDERYIRLSPTVTNDVKARAAEDLKPQQKLYNYLEREHPSVLDVVRETLIRAREMKLKWRLPRTRGESFFGTRRQQKQFEYRLVRPMPPKEGAPQAILFGLHWLQTGGAERWAFETIQIAKDEGYLPIVLTDQLSHHHWATRPELEGCVLLPLTMPLQHWHGDEPLLRFMAETYDLRAVVVHHCMWLYTRLPWFKKYLPQLPVIDGLHIIEYKYGGYPGVSVSYDDYIDLHHVISPQLVRWMVDTQGVHPDKMVLAPLVGLTADEPVAFKPRSGDQFTIAFVGRLARQKRPDIFLVVAQMLHAAYPNIRFLLHGDGELEPIVERQLAERELSDVVERRGEGTPVSQTLAEADLLLLTSANEGLALTVFEAISAGVPVVSTDVGSQDTLVPADGLVDRAASRMLRQLEPLVGMLMENEDVREDLWQRERASLRDFADLPTASEWATEWMKGLQR